MHSGWLIFRNTKSWYKALFKNGFSHVSVIIADADRDVYLHIDPVGTGIRYDLVGIEEIKHMIARHADIEERGVHIEYIEFDGEDGIKHKPSVFTCVELVKRTIGLRKWWIITPYQLYKHYTRLK